MTEFLQTTRPTFTQGDRVQLVSTDLFLTLVVFEAGDLGVILRSCEMSGLWWVVFDRAPDEPVRLPAYALARSEVPLVEAFLPPTLDDHDAPIALPELIPVIIESLPLGVTLPDASTAVAALDTAAPAAPSRHHALPTSHAGDMRLAPHGRYVELSAFGFLD